MQERKIVVFAGNPLIDIREGNVHQELQMRAFESAIRFSKENKDQVEAIYLLFDQIGDMRRFLIGRKTKGLTLDRMLETIREPYKEALDRHGLEESDIRIMLEGQLRIAMLQSLKSKPELSGVSPKLFGDPGACREGVVRRHNDIGSRNLRVTCRALVAETYRRLERRLDAENGLIKAYWEYDMGRVNMVVVSDGINAARKYLGVKADIETKLIMPSGEMIECPMDSFDA